MFQTLFTMKTAASMYTKNVEMIIQILSQSYHLKSDDHLQSWIANISNHIFQLLISNATAFCVVMQLISLMQKHSDISMLHFSHVMALEFQETILANLAVDTEGGN